jgi:hypothetical protein
MLKLTPPIKSDFNHDDDLSPTLTKDFHIDLLNTSPAAPAVAAVPVDESKEQSIAAVPAAPAAPVMESPSAAPAVAAVPVDESKEQSIAAVPAAPAAPVMESPSAAPAVAAVPVDESKEQSIAAVPAAPAAPVMESPSAAPAALASMVADSVASTARRQAGECLVGLSIRDFPVDASSDLTFMERAQRYSSNLVPLNTDLYKASYPGLLLSRTQELASLHRPYAILFVLDIQLQTSLDEQLADETAGHVPLLPYYICSASDSDPFAATLLADVRQLVKGGTVASQSNGSDAARLEPHLRKLRHGRRHPNTGVAIEESSVQSDHGDTAVPEQYQQEAISFFKQQLSFTVHAKDRTFGTFPGEQIAQVREANVELLRVGSCWGDGRRSDRNWLSGLLFAGENSSLQFRYKPSGATGVIGPFPRTGTNTTPSVSLFHWDNSVEGLDNDKGFEPLIPASELFRLCAGPSHPMFSGHVSAWFPLSAELYCTYFAVPYYVGYINWCWEDINYHRKYPGLQWLSQERRESRVATIREGSVVKYEHTSTDGTIQYRHAIVALVYVRLSRSITSKWMEHARTALSALPGAIAKLETFVSAHPYTPVVLLALLRLSGTDGVHIDGLGTKLHVQRHLMDDDDKTFVHLEASAVVEVVTPDPTHPLWSVTAGDVKRAQHVKSFTAAGKGKSKVRIEYDAVALPERRINVLLESRQSDLRQWEHVCVMEMKSDAQACSQQRSRFSFYDDIVGAAVSGFDITPVMVARGVLTLPYEQNPTDPLAGWYGATTSQCVEVFKFKADVAVASSSQTAEKPKARKPVEGISDDERDRKKPRRVTKDNAAEDSGVQELDRQEYLRKRLTELFASLSDFEAPECDQPFAHVVWARVSSSYRVNKKVPAHAVTTARKYALEQIERVNKPLYALLFAEAGAGTSSAGVVAKLRAQRKNDITPGEPFAWRGWSTYHQLKKTDSKRTARERWLKMAEDAAADRKQLDPFHSLLPAGQHVGQLIQPALDSGRAPVRGKLKELTQPAVVKQSAGTSAAAARPKLSAAAAVAVDKQLRAQDEALRAKDEAHEKQLAEMQAKLLVYEIANRAKAAPTASAAAAATASKKVNQKGKRQKTGADAGAIASAAVASRTERAQARAAQVQETEDEEEKEGRAPPRKKAKHGGKGVKKAVNKELRVRLDKEDDSDATPPLKKPRHSGIQVKIEDTTHPPPHQDPGITATMIAAVKAEFSTEIGAIKESMAEKHASYERTQERLQNSLAQQGEKLADMGDNVGLINTTASKAFKLILGTLNDVQQQLHSRSLKPAEPLQQHALPYYQQPQLYAPQSHGQPMLTAHGHHYHASQPMPMQYFPSAGSYSNTMHSYHPSMAMEVQHDENHEPAFHTAIHPNVQAKGVFQGKAAFSNRR